MRWRVSLSYLEALKKRDTLYVDVIVTPIPQKKKADAALQHRLEGIIDRAFLRHEAYRDEARDWLTKAERARSASWRTRYRNEASRLMRLGLRTERRAGQEVRLLEREHDARFAADVEPSIDDIRNAYRQALREGKNLPGFTIKVVTWWHDRGRGETGYREGSVSDLPSMFGPLSHHKCKLVIGKENENE